MGSSLSSVSHSNLKLEGLLKKQVKKTKEQEKKKKKGNP